MTNGKSNPENDSQKTKSTEDSEDESDILEESPCGRWSKRKQQVHQRDVPGINSFLAMDTEEGMEVVWNEVQFSEKINLKEQEEDIKHVFEKLKKLKHSNIVKLHNYWIDSKEDRRRNSVKEKSPSAEGDGLDLGRFNLAPLQERKGKWFVFITEYMSSGSLKKFLKLTKRNVKKLPLQSWKRWCNQILSALRYLHSCSPPITHGNLTTDTIFIQHNGLIKIGSVAPDTIQTHVKTCKGDMKNMHYLAPEYRSLQQLTPAVDIYSFGVSALEMAALEITGNGDSGSHITEEQIQKTIQSLDNELQKDFIQECLKADPTSRPCTRSLLFHGAIFEVPQLKLLSALTFIHNAKKSAKSIDNCIELMLQKQYKDESVVAVVQFTGCEPKCITVGDIKLSEKLEKFIEDVRDDIYPLMCFESKGVTSQESISPSDTNNSKLENNPFPMAVETRRILNAHASLCDVKQNSEGPGLVLTLSLRLEDMMNRVLTGTIQDGDSAKVLAEELVRYGFISQVDCNRISDLIEAEMSSVHRGIPYVTVNGGISSSDDSAR